LAPTQEAASYLKQIGVRNVEVWGRGVDLDLFHPANKESTDVLALRKKLAPKGETIIGFVGRLATEKQVNRMSELLSLPNTSFVIVGDGPERSKLEKQFAGHKVYFAGRQTGIELSNYYAALDIFVHFGTEETFGQTIQEAQATGLAVVAPNVGGPKYLIDDRVSGLLANPERPYGYREKVLELLEDENLQASLALEARRAVANKSWEVNNSKLIEFYQRAISQKATKVASIELA